MLPAIASAQCGGVLAALQQLKLQKAIVIHQAKSGKWRASIDEGNTQTAVFGETAEDAVSKLARYRRG